MPISVGQSLAIIAVTALCTIFSRAFPFLVFGGKKEVPKAVRDLGAVLPSSIMAVLVVYCLRDMDFAAAGHFLPYVISCLLVVGLHLWKKNILLSIGLGTVCYMVLVQAVFV